MECAEKEFQFLEEEGEVSTGPDGKLHCKVSSPVSCVRLREDPEIANNTEEFVMPDNIEYEVFKDDGKFDESSTLDAAETLGFEIAAEDGGKISVGTDVFREPEGNDFVVGEDHGGKFERNSATTDQDIQLEVSGLEVEAMENLATTEREMADTLINPVTDQHPDPENGLTHNPSV